MSRVTRREKLRDLMQRLELGALLLRRPANFAWYTGGADNRVDHASEVGVAGVLLTVEAEFVVTDNVEAGRMHEEQTPEMEVVEYPWQEGSDALIRDLTGGAPLGADAAATGATDVSGEVAPLRHVLDPDAIEGYRALCADASEAVAEVAASLVPETGELEAAADLAAALRERGVFAPVLLAASGRRLGLYRHPIPRGDPLGTRAMLVACAERGGLYANLTRIVEFGEPDPETRRRQAACEAVLRRMREATTPGRTLGELFEDCKRYYADEGFPDGWREHHQGGLTGYASRELVAAPGSRYEVRANQAFAWNPSLAGAKAEETFLLTASGPDVMAGAGP